MKKYNGIVALILELGNVNEIDQVTFEQLECGDKVIIKDNGTQEMYVLTKLSASSMSLVAQDASGVKEKVFTKTNGVWAYNAGSSKEIKYSDLLVGDLKVDGDLTVEDDIVVKGTLSVGTPAVYDISDIEDGDTVSRDRLTQILQAFASGKIITHGGYSLNLQMFYSYDEAVVGTDVVVLSSVIYENSVIDNFEQLTFTKQEDGSLLVSLEEM